MSSAVWMEFIVMSQILPADMNTLIKLLEMLH